MPTEEAVKFASANDIVFFETSALNADYVEEAFNRAAADVYLGVVTMRYDQDENGDYVGIKKGNVELPAAKRMSARMTSMADLNESMPDLRIKTGQNLHNQQ